MWSNFVCPLGPFLLAQSHIRIYLAQTYYASVLGRVSLSIYENNLLTLITMSFCQYKDCLIRIKQSLYWQSQGLIKVMAVKGTA